MSIARLVGWVLSHRRTTLAALALVVALCAIGLTRLELDFSSRAFFADADRDTAVLQAFEDTWGPEDNQLFVVFEHAQGVTTPARTRAIHTAAETLRRHPQVAEVVDFTVLPQQELAPYVPLLLAADHRSAALAVRLNLGSDDLGAIVPVIQSLRRRLQTVDVGDLKWELAGVPSVRAAFFALTLHDQTRFVPAGMVVMALCLALALRTMRGVAVPMAAAALPTAMVLGLMGWLGEPIGLLNQAYFTLIPVIAVADALHMVIRIEREAHLRLRQGESGPAARHEAITVGVMRVGKACLLTSLTTGIGLASLGLASMPTVRRFGLFAAVAIAFAYLTVLVLVPLLLSFSQRLGTRSPVEPPRWIRVASAAAIRRPATVLVITAIVVAVAGWGAQRVQVDNRLTELLAPGHAVRVASERLDESLGGSLSVELEFVGSEMVLSSAATVRAIASFTTWARNHPDIRVVIGPHPLRLRSRAGVAVGHLSIRARDQGGQAFTALARRVADALQQRLPTGVSVTATGTPRLAYIGINRMGNDLKRSLGAAFIVIAAVIAWLFRSLRLAAVSMIPNLIPLLCAYGAMGLLGIDLDPLGGVVLTLALGIAVDDTVHVLARFREEQTDGRERVEALRTAVEETGRAMAVTTFALCLGLSINMASSFPPLRLLGALGTAAVAIALICDVVVLPALWTVGRSATARR